MSSSSSSSSRSSSNAPSPGRPPPAQLPPPPVRPPSTPALRAQTPTTTAAPSAWHPPLLLTVRFSTSIPDTLLDIPHPQRTTVVALKHLIRTRLAEPNSQRRLRFIQGGKILPDAAVLSGVLRVPPPPPPSELHHHHPLHHREQQQHDPKGKGKGKAGEVPPQRVYVNCSIGDSLTDEELKAEARAAEAPVPEPKSGASAAAAPPFPPGSRGQSPGLLIDAAGGGGVGVGGDGTQDTAAGRQQRGPPPWPRAAPRGFDRLLSAGFTRAEVNQLRLQFRSIQETRYTADTLPSPDTMLAMEDAWLDDNAAGGFGGSSGPAAAGGGDGGANVTDGMDDFGMAGMLDPMLRGMLIGFVWPLGSMGWLVRDEQEKISKRTRVFVYLGFALSFLIGALRATN